MWQAASTPPSNAASSSRTVATSPRMKATPLGTFSRFPVDSLSITTTRWPAARIPSAKCEPMKPAPPVISTFMIGIGLPSCEAGPRSQDIKLFAPAGNQPRVDHLAPLSVRLQQSIQTSFIEAVGLIARAGIGQLSSQKREQSALAICHIANRFSDQQLLLRGRQHAPHYRRGIRQEMVQARLHDHIFLPR